MPTREEPNVYPFTEWGELQNLDDSGRTLRIGIMLRGIDEIDGPGVYIRKLCDSLLEGDRRNQYTLFYMRPDQSGRYAHHPNVREIVVPAFSKLIWDQVKVPLAARKESLDVLFHHKFSVPLLVPCPTVVQQRGIEYWTSPRDYGWIERLHATRMIPIYCRRAVRVFTVSDHVADGLQRYAGVPREKLYTLRAGADPSFVPVRDRAVWERVRAKYRLPEPPYLLMVAKGYSSIHARRKLLYPRKNIMGTVVAYGKVHKRLDNPPPLVIAGARIAEHLSTETIQEHVDPKAVHVAGYIDHADMPAVYGMTRALIFPSFAEGLPIPLVEAMACGCAIVTSRIAPCIEAAGDAAILVDPSDTNELADAMMRVATDDELLRELQQRSLVRAREFSWETSARRLLATFREVARKNKDD